MSGPSEERILDILRSSVSPILAKSILSLSVSRARVRIGQLRSGDDRALLGEMKQGLRLYVRDPGERQKCIDRLSLLFREESPNLATAKREIVIEISEETHIVSARGAGRDLCQEIGFSGAVQIKVATAISELARNIVQYAGRGEIVITTLEGMRRGIEVVARDQGPGIAELDKVLSGQFNSKRGMGIGLRGTKKLMDEFDIKTEPGQGTEIRIKKLL